MIMKYINAIFAAFCLLSCVCCSKPDNGGEEPLLEVNRNNISGEWELVEWNGNSLEEGTFFRITLVRNDGTFTIVQNMDAFPEIPREITGRYDLREDEVYGSVISGIYDHDSGFWSHEYSISSLTAVRMQWVAVDEPGFVQIFERVK